MPNAVHETKPAVPLPVMHNTTKIPDEMKRNLMPQVSQPSSYVSNGNVDHQPFFRNIMNVSPYSVPPVTSIPQHTNNSNSTNSIVIMNSRMQFPNHDQNPVLSGISFCNTICLGLPPKLTWEELNESPNSTADVMSLLKYTKELNKELNRKRRSKSSLKTKTKAANNTVSSKSAEQLKNSKVAVVSTSNKETNVSTSNIKMEQKPSKIFPKRHQLKEASVVEKKLVQNVCVEDKFKNIEATEVQQKMSVIHNVEQTATTVKNSEQSKTDVTDTSSVPISERRKITIEDLLKVKDEAPTNQEIIETILAHGIYRGNNVLNSSECNHSKKSQKLNNDASKLQPIARVLSREPCKMDAERPDGFIMKTNCSSCLRNSSNVENKLKYLLQNSSWLDSDDYVDTHSKKILQDLETVVKELEKDNDKKEKEKSNKDSKKQEKEKSKIQAGESDEPRASALDLYDNMIVAIEKDDVLMQEEPGGKKSKKSKRKFKKEALAVAKKEEDIKILRTIDSDDEPFDDYYDEVTINEGLKSGTMFKEILRINSKNTKEAYISCEFYDKDIFINGVKDRNRALEGDEVVVELYREEEWKWLPNNTVQKCGKVVAITQKNHPRTTVGYLKAVFSKPSGIVLWPRDNRIPKIRISEKSCPVKFKKNRKLYETTLFLAKITSWNTVKSAEGEVIEKLGDENALDIQSKCILQENNLDAEPFEDVQKYLPKSTYLISNEEISKRVDLRNRCIFTIDPPSARDLDDAFSCSVLNDGFVNVGIHIADVSHYVLPNTPLDDNIRDKATSVYLTEKVFHMLPMALCQLCSLTPNVDKLAFSVFVTLDENANIINHRFAKTVIRSCAQLTYDNAQEVIDKKNENVSETFPDIKNGFSVKECANAIWHLHKLAMKMRERRFTEGALRIDQPKISFHLNETGLPISYTLHEGKECNWLVEEFMLLANILAANKIHETFPSTALLRFHRTPHEDALTKVVEFLEKVGIHIDISSAGTIYRSMMQYSGTDELGIARMAVIMNLLVKPMQRACYTCSIPNIDNCADLWHYALNTPFYTHFTSPIRRYADVVVHRFLAASIGAAEKPKWTADDITKIAANCNGKKNAAKKASEMSTELYLKLYLEKNGPIKARAVVIDVKERFFEVIDLSTRTLGRIYVDKIKGAKSIDYEESMPSLIIKWNGNKENETVVQIFMIVDVELSYKNVNKYSNNSITFTLLKSAR